ncbi:MAG: GNAT family N-acetyltransferase [Acutalibacteraceae bacterium]
MGIDYTVCEADASQRAYVWERFSLGGGDAQRQAQAVVWVAVTAQGQIIGRIVLEERELPEPFVGKSYFIANLLTHADFRRQGVAAALVDAVKRQAASRGICCLYGSANATAEASLFWLAQGFTLHAYGRKQEDPCKPLWYGNYYHIISYRSAAPRCVTAPLRPASSVASAEETDGALDALAGCADVSESAAALWRGKRASLAGFVAQDDAGRVIGRLLMYPDSMQPPVDGTRFFLRLLVEPEARLRGVGRTLVCAAAAYARESGAMQLSVFEPNQTWVGFWDQLGFDIYFYDKNAVTGRRAVTAMRRLDTP